MQTLAHKSVRIDSLYLPADWQKILEEPEVLERAESIDAIGLIHEPMVRQSDMKLLAGRRRVAAHVRLGRQEVEVKLVSCTDEEAIEVEFQENLSRHHYDPPALRELTAKRIEHLARLEARESRGVEPRPPGKKGRDKTPKGKARDKVAKERGVKPESLRQQEYRANKRDAKKTAGKEAKADAALKQEAAPIKTLGFELQADFTASVQAIQAIMRDAGSKLRQASAALTQLRNAELGYPEARLDRLREELKSFTAKVASHLPSSLCPFCKGLDPIQEECQACMGAGWIVEAQMEGVPAELWRESDPVVMSQGTMYPAADYMDSDDEVGWP